MGVSRWAHALRLVAFLLTIFDFLAFIVKFAATPQVDVMNLADAKIEKYYDVQDKHHHKQVVINGICHPFEYMVGFEEFSLANVKGINRELHRNRDVTMAAVMKRGADLEYACKHFKKDRDIVIAAVRNDPEALQYAHKDLRKDKHVLQAS